MCQFDIRLMSLFCAFVRTISSSFSDCNLPWARSLGPCSYSSLQFRNFKRNELEVFFLLPFNYYSSPLIPCQLCFELLVLDLVAVALYPHNLARQEEVDIALLRVATSMLQAASWLWFLWFLFPCPSLPAEFGWILEWIWKATFDGA